MTPELLRARLRTVRDTTVLTFATLALAMVVMGSEGVLSPAGAFVARALITWLPMQVALATAVLVMLRPRTVPATGSPEAVPDR